MKITKDDVKYVASLARLNVSEEEAEKLTCEMESIINFADMLSETDTNDIEPTNHAIKLQNVLREDEIGECLDRELLLENAPSKDFGCYKVPKVVD